MAESIALFRTSTAERFGSLSASLAESDWVEALCSGLARDRWGCRHGRRLGRSAAPRRNCRQLARPRRPGGAPPELAHRLKELAAGGGIGTLRARSRPRLPRGVKGTVAMTSSPRSSGTLGPTR